jgi:3-deoxy-D-manno-octulosonic-acid transferase
MMWLLYDAVIGLLIAALRISSLFSAKNKNFLNSRSGQFSNISANETSRPTMCFHCASLGEYEMIIPLLSDGSLKKKFYLIVTFFSPSGYNHAKTDGLIDAKYYLPLDTAKNMRKFVDFVNPTVFIFVKYDIWFRLIHELISQNVKVILVNGLFRKNQFLLKKWNSFFRKQLGSFNRIFVQNEISKELLAQGKIPREIIESVPDLRFDRVYDKSQNVRPIARIEEFKGGSPLLILGSSWLTEETFLESWMSDRKLNCKILIAPHDISPSHISGISKQLQNFQVNRWSEDEDSSADVMIIDNIGILSSAYQYGDVAFIGGGFGKGLHNILEAATFGMPIICGPNINKFPEALMLKNKGVLTVVEYASDFDIVIKGYLENRSLRENISSISKQVIEVSRGGRDRILPYLQNL